MDAYHLIPVQFAEDEREALLSVRDGLSSDERIVGHIVDADASPRVLVVIVQSA